MKYVQAFFCLFIESWMPTSLTFAQSPSLSTEQRQGDTIQVSINRSASPLGTSENYYGDNPTKTDKRPKVWGWISSTKAHIPTSPKRPFAQVLCRITTWHSEAVRRRPIIVLLSPADVRALNNNLTQNQGY